MKKTLKFAFVLLAVCAMAQSLPVAAKETKSPATVPATATATEQQPDTGAQPDAVEEAAIPGQPSYKIIAGDVLQITVWKEDGLDQEVLVLPGGMINFPLVGSLEAQGKTPAQLQVAIKEKLKKFIPDAAVTVSVKAALGHTISVIGQVTKPGEFVMGRHLTVMQALSQAGGLTPYASESGIIILRHDESGKETSIPFPYDDVVEGYKLDKDIVLNPGDVVVVPTAGLL